MDSQCQSDTSIGHLCGIAKAVNSETTWGALLVVVTLSTRHRKCELTDRRQEYLDITAGDKLELS